MRRLSVLPVVRGHWKSLAMRRFGPHGLAVGEPDIPSRVMTIMVPSGGTAVAAWICLAKGWGLDVTVAGFIVGAAALIVGGVLAAFGQLSSWRSFLTQRDRDQERALRAMVDEAATHMLLAVIEAVLVTTLAVLGLLLAQLGAGAWSLLATAPMVGLAIHVTFLLALAVPRLYSAYTQVNEVDASVDGYARR